MVRVHQGPPYAGVAKLADALDLGSSALWHGGSSPFTCTIEVKSRTLSDFTYIKFIVFDIMGFFHCCKGVDEFL